MCIDRFRAQDFGIPGLKKMRTYGVLRGIAGFLGGAGHDVEPNGEGHEK